MWEKLALVACAEQSGQVIMSKYDTQCSSCVTASAAQHLLITGMSCACNGSVGCWSDHYTMPCTHGRHSTTCNNCC
jgi:hypothetical protein